MDQSELETLLREQVERGEITPEEAVAREAGHARNSAGDSHLQSGRLFEEPQRRRGRIILVGDKDPFEVAQGMETESAADMKQRARRPMRIQKAVEDALLNRVADPVAADVLKVSFEEFMKIMNDPEFEPFTKYAPHIIYLTAPDGTVSNVPRARPLRPFLQNEVGMLGGKFVILKDSGPGDVGEGKYHTPGAQLLSEAKTLTENEIPESVVGAEDD